MDYETTIYMGCKSGDYTIVTLLLTSLHVGRVLGLLQTGDGSGLQGDDLSPTQDTEDCL